ncbi:MAG: L-lactate permease [Pirellulales bacterium]|nr:L-lactate permease [Pirellulales bacterium]
MVWVQPYNPLGSEWLSTVAAALPVVVLLGGLAFAGWSAPRAAAAGLFTAFLVAVGAYGMPWQAAVASAGFGACFGLFPIGWIVFTAVFLYLLTVEAGAFEKVKASVVALSPDRRLQSLLIAFGFGAFLEGAAGFGTPVAISGALLMGAGFPPLYAAGLTLIANTAPVAFGALGTPIVTLAKVTGLPEMVLSAMAGRQLPFFSLIVPAWMVCTMSGWRGLMGVCPAVVVSGGVFAVVQFLVSNYLGPSLTDVLGGVATMVALAVLLRMWRPAETWRFPEELAHEKTKETSVTTTNPRIANPSAAANPTAALGTTHDYTRRELIHAWVPWATLTACIFLWGLPQFRTLADGGAKPRIAAQTPAETTQLAWWQRPNILAGISEFQWPIPFLHQTVQPGEPVASTEVLPKPAIFRFNWLSATGTSIFLASLFAAVWLGITPYRFLRVFLLTLTRLRESLFTIAAMLGLAYLTQFCGSDVTLGLAFTKTGVLYPFFAAMLGWLGVALTGSDTSSNALFGNLQRITAERLGLNPILICAANSTGGVMGKMIDAQSIVVASAATGQRGTEGRILRFVFWHSVVLASLVGLLTFAQATWLTWMVP